MDNEQHTTDSRRIMYNVQRTKSSIVHRTLSTISILLLRHARRQTVAPAVVIVVASIILGFGYLADQQMLRQGANDPQIQIAKDAAAALGRGAIPSAIAASASAGRQIDLAESQATFVMVFDDNGSVVQSSGIIKGLPPILPRGVFNYVKNHGEDRITWQPQKGIRLAAVVERVQGRNTGFVLAARSLAEVEKREAALFLQFFIAWLLVVVAVVGGHWFKRKLRE